MEELTKNLKVSQKDWKVRPKGEFRKPKGKMITDSVSP